MTKRNFVVAGVLAMLMMLVVSSTPAAPTPKDTARYVAGPQVFPVASRTVPEPVGSTTGVRRVAITSLATPDYAGWRAAQIRLADDSGSNGSLGVVVCYASGGACSGAGGISLTFCTKSNGTIDLRKHGLKPGAGLSIRIGVVQSGAVQGLECDGVATTGTIYVTYCKNKKGKKFC